MCYHYRLVIILVCVCVTQGMYGQLGHGNTEKQSSPRMVEQLAHKTVYLLACGNFHTVSVDTEHAH